MRNLLKNKRIILLLVILACVFTVASLAADPGSSSDPLISLSYFEDKIEDLKTTLIDSLTESLSTKFDALSNSFSSKFDVLSESFTTKFNESKKELDDAINDINKNGISSPTEFTVITLNEGETIICEASTEIIVRAGKSVIVTSETSTGGISDITAGKDLANGEEIEKNHLLIVPKSDGRGIKGVVTGAVMIKGKYESKIEGI